MDVSFLDSAHAECERFIARTAGARLCHMPAWTDMVEQTFGHRGYYLLARDYGDICGVLPLTHVRSRLFGNRIISQPFNDYGGPVVTDPAALPALYDRAVEIATRCRCDSIEFRNTVPLAYDLRLRTDKMSMYLPLTSDPQDLWKTLRHKTRNRVRKAERAGLTVTSGGPELLEEFYRVWTIRMRELGTPCYPRRLFHNIMETFPGSGRVFLARLDGVTTAVLFAYTFKGWVQCSWGAALRDFDGMGPNYILNWRAIEYYCEKGMRWFDFGRSTIGSGQHTFKQRWGAEPIQLCWQYWTASDRKLTLTRPTDTRYRRKVELWKRMPLWTSRLVGPWLSRSLG